MPLRGSPRTVPVARGTVTPMHGTGDDRAGASTTHRRGPVDGVVVSPLRRVDTERGHLLEIARRDDQWFVDFGQVYATSTLPGVIKAWYRHQAQDDTLTVLTGTALIALYDDRPASPTYGNVQVEEIGRDAPRCIVVPRLVWHGFQAISAEPIVLVHVNSEPFEFDEPDEERREPIDPAMPDVWQPWT